MTDWRHVRSLGVERPGQAYFFGYDEAPPADGQVRLDLLYTGFSAGTELTFVKNTNPYLHSRWDAARGVFVPGEMLDGFVAWPASVEDNARRFAELAAERTVVSRPGQLCWFDTGPAADEEFKRLSA